MKKSNPFISRILLFLLIALLAGGAGWFYLKGGKAWGIGPASARAAHGQEAARDSLGRSRGTPPGRAPVSLGGGPGGSGGSAAPPVFTSGGRLTTATVERLRLTDEEEDAVTEALGRMQDAVAKDFVARTKLVSSQSNGADFRYNYYTTARPDEGQAFLDTLHHEVDGLIGEERSRELMAAVRNVEFAGGMGKYGLETEMANERGCPVVTQKYVEKNGTVARVVESSPQSFRERFGDLFEIPDGS